jgi:hypothetical protein
VFTVIRSAIVDMFPPSVGIIPESNRGATRLIEKKLSRGKLHLPVFDGLSTLELLWIENWKRGEDVGLLPKGGILLWEG